MAEGEARERIARLIADLDGDRLAQREQASKELLKLGSIAISALVEASATTQSAEVRRRADAVLARLTRSGGVLRLIRAVEVLERVGSSDAVEVVSQLARGATGAPLTEEALATYARLRARGVGQ